MSFALSILLIASPPKVPPCVQELSALLQREEFDAVLAGAGACEEQSAHPRTHYFVGIAQLAKRRPERAIEPLQRYLAADAAGEPPRLREIAAVRLEQARSEVGVVELRIEPSSSEVDTRVTIEYEGWDEPVVKFFSDFEQKDGRAIVVLPPGSYHITAARAGFLPARQVLSVAAAGETVSILLPLRLWLAPVEKAPERPTFPRQRWAGVWGGIGGGVALAGIPAATVGTIRSWNLFDSCMTSDEDIDRCRADLAKGTMLRAGGAGMLGVGLGLMVGGLTGLAIKERARKIGWAAEVGVGGALAVVGAIFLGVAQKSFNQINNSTDAGLPAWGPLYEERLNPSLRGFVAGAALLGAGVGVGLSAAVGLASPKISRRPLRAAVRWHLGPDGFTVKF